MGQLFLKKSAVKPSGPGALSSEIEKRLSLISSSVTALQMVRSLEVLVAAGKCL